MCLKWNWSVFKTTSQSRVILHSWFKIHLNQRIFTWYCLLGLSRTNLFLCNFEQTLDVVFCQIRGHQVCDFCAGFFSVGFRAKKIQISVCGEDFNCCGSGVKLRDKFRFCWQREYDEKSWYWLSCVFYKLGLLNVKQHQSLAKRNMSMLASAYWSAHNTQYNCHAARKLNLSGNSTGANVPNAGISVEEKRYIYSGDFNFQMRNYRWQFGLSTAWFALWMKTPRVKVLSDCTKPFRIAALSRPISVSCSQNTTSVKRPWRRSLVV